MPAALYSIRIQGKRDNFEHPHLVVVQVGENCLCVPAFSSGGHELEETISALGRQGIFPHQCSVEIDNAKHVKFADGRTGRLATWIVARRQILSLSAIRNHPVIGEMDNYGLLQVVECIIEWNRNRPEDLPPKIARALKRLMEELLEDKRRSAPSSDS